MTTENPAGREESAKHLTEMILKGDSENAARIAEVIAERGVETNDAVDAISEAMNIAADLHEVERYSLEQVESSQRAAERALETIRPSIRVEQRRVSGRVMVASLLGDPHNFDKTLLLTMLEIGGFSALDGGAELSPEDLSEKVSKTKPDILAVSLVTPLAAKKLVEAQSLIGEGRTKTRIVAYGRGISELPKSVGLSAIVEDHMGALSKIAEMLIQLP